MTERSGRIDPTEMPLFWGIRTFFRLPHVPDPSQLDAGLIGVPFDFFQGNRPGSRFMPNAVRDLSSNVRRPWHIALNVNPFERFRIGDCGDIPINPHDWEESFGHIERGISRLLDAGVLPVAVGGDHSITYPILRAIAGKHGPVGVVQVDAHADCYDSTFRGMRHNTATMFRRGVEEKLIDPVRMVQIGLRGGIYRQDDYDWPREQGFRMVLAEEVHERGIGPIVQEIQARMAGRKCYLTIDLDGMDPAYAPGVTGPTPGGLSSADVMYLIRGMRGLDVVGFDIVELQPRFDHDGVTGVLTAYLMFEFLCSRC